MVLLCDLEESIDFDSASITKGLFWKKDTQVKKGKQPQ
jgi:hypothetical protein